MKAKISMGIRIAIHGFIGALIGYFLLHPVSMFIYYNFEQTPPLNWNIIRISFSPHHFTMAVFFALLGTVFGVMQGIYIQRIGRLYNKVKALSVTDDLTSLHNRRYFFNKLEEEIARARRYSRKAFLFMLDIDNFKQYNDSLGHQEGDAILRIFADRLRKSVRVPDFVARYGGKEFAIIMPEANDDMAFRMAERLCEEIASYPFADNENLSSGNLTISIGIAGFPDDGGDAVELIRKADSALYSAKREGKNRVCRFETRTSIRSSHK
jgi:diguanylate cyclase (GGDEF)-like protein